MHLSVAVLTGLVNVNHYQCHHLTAHCTQLQQTPGGAVLLGYDCYSGCSNGNGGYSLLCGSVDWTSECESLPVSSSDSSLYSAAKELQQTLIDAILFTYLYS